MEIPKFKLNKEQITVIQDANGSTIYKPVDFDWFRKED
jgi:hypothetical protein